MNKNFKAGAQGGFTLIELIVVIVILGILAATALPKFVNLSGDARYASINAAKGALAATSGMVHGKSLVGAASPINVEGTNVAVTAGYPTANKDFAFAAGLNETDYKLDVATANKLIVSPIGVGDATKCNATYTWAGTANTAPTIAVTGNGTDCT